MKKVVIIGGGISGLASAYRLQRGAAERGLPLRVQLIEAGDRPGGKVSTDDHDGFVCEAGPQGFLDNEPATLRLVDDLGLNDRLLRSNEAAAERYIYRNGRFNALGMNPIKFMSSPLLSLPGRLSVVGEFFRPARTDGAEETVGEFGRRRLGKEFTEVLLDSMVSGIHAGDIDRLSIPAAFPKIVELESQHGGLFKGMIAKQKEKKREAKAAGAKAEKVEAGPGGALHTFKGGMVEPVDALAKVLGPDVIRLSTKVERIEAGSARYLLFLEDSRGESSTIEADAILLATPGHASAEILSGFADEAAKALGDIHFAGVHVVCLGYRRDQVPHHLHGFGALIPRNEGVRVLGTIWSSSTFDCQAPDDHVLLRTLVGGRHDAAANDLSDDELIELVREETEPQYGITSAPVLVNLFRWPRGIPQYELGHLDRVARAKAALEAHPGMYLTGNSVCGISFNQCIAHSEEIAGEILDDMTQAAAGRG